jgi:hypothetical protein
LAHGLFFVSIAVVLVPRSTLIAGQRVYALTGAEARDDSATGQIALEGLAGEAASKDGFGSGQGNCMDLDISEVAKHVFLTNSGLTDKR